MGRGVLNGGLRLAEARGRIRHAVPAPRHGGGEDVELVDRALAPTRARAKLQLGQAARCCGLHSRHCILNTPLPVCSRLSPDGEHAVVQGLCGHNPLQVGQIAVQLVLIRMINLSRARGALVLQKRLCQLVFHT